MHLLKALDRTDFEWVYTDEPHATRRKEILAKHPEVRQLMKCNPWFKYQVLLLVALQISLAYAFRSLTWGWLLLAAYSIGGTLNHSLTLAVHEIAHNHAFGVKYPLRNRIFGFIANLPIGVPMSVSFKKYHLEHHKFQGDREIDTDIPTLLEARLFNSQLGKVVWLSLQSLFYSVRPLLVRPKPPTGLEVVNLIVQFTFNYLIYYLFGWQSLVYLVSGSFLALGLHPVSGHFISEHYMFVKGFETYSYYGPLNSIVFNVGYHNEHHDFPNIPGSYLPKVREIAPEFYDHLPHHTSWLKVLYDFVTCSEVGLYSRVLRSNKAGKSDNGVTAEHKANGHGKGKTNGITNGHAKHE